jgi:hypothetical protein
MQKLARSIVATFIAVSFIGYADVADCANKPGKPTKPSSYAPGPSNQRVYGAPIQGPIVTSAASRSQRAKSDFQRMTPCPVTGKSTGTCPGYTIAYKKSLARGGANAPGNMEWKPTQLAGNAKAKMAQP